MTEFKPKIVPISADIREFVRQNFSPDAQYHREYYVIYEVALTAAEARIAKLEKAGQEFIDGEISHMEFENILKDVE